VVSVLEQELRGRFQGHALDDERGAAVMEVRDLCLDLALRLNDLAPDGREKSVAVTHLEDVMHWGNKAIARTMTAAP
jgi:hypothetical protein